MFADRAHLAKVHYSRLNRGLFTAGLLLFTLSLLAQDSNKSLVVKVRDPMATHFFKPNPERVRAMVHTGVQRVTGEKTSVAAWSSMFTPKDVVGIKVNSRSGTLIGTRPSVVAAVIASLWARDPSVFWCPDMNGPDGIASLEGWLYVPVYL